MSEELLPCPLCNCTDFDMSENTDDRVTGIYCTDCPYGVEDSTKTLAELRVWHNTRPDSKPYKYPEIRDVFGVVESHDDWRFADREAIWELLVTAARERE